MSDRQNALEIADRILSPRFASLGTEWRGDRNWVQPGDVVMRRVIQLSLLKGDSAVLAWGLSFNFVPSISGLRLVYHPTVRSARMDLFEWPASYAASFSKVGNIRFDRVDCRKAEFERSLTRYADEVLPELYGWFSRMRSMKDVELELQRQASSSDLAYRIHHPAQNYVMAFVKAAAGELEAAKRLLAETLGDEVDAELQSALGKALELANKFTEPSSLFVSS